MRKKSLARAAFFLPANLSEPSTMADRKLDGAETTVQEHVRKILARLSALRDRPRAQEADQQSGSRGTVEIDRQDDHASLVDHAHLPP